MIIDNNLILSCANQNEITLHPIITGKEKHIGNKNYLRDYSLKIDLLIDNIATDFHDSAIASENLNQISKDNPHYIRDQLTLFKQQTQRYKMKVMEQSQH